MLTRPEPLSLGPHIIGLTKPLKCREYRMVKEIDITESLVSRITIFRTIVPMYCKILHSYYRIVGQYSTSRWWYNERNKESKKDFDLWYLKDFTLCGHY